MDAAIVVEFFSAGPSDFSDMAYSSCRFLVYACRVLATPMHAFIHDVSSGLASLVGASSTSFSSVYACPVLATPVRAFVHDVSPDLANLPRRVVNNIFFPTHPYFGTTAPMLTRCPLAPAAPRRLPRHRLPRLDIDHGILRTATSITAPPPYALGYIDIGTKGYHPLEQLVGFLYSQRARDATPSTTLPLGLWGDVSLSAAILSSLTVRDAPVVCDATATTAGGC